MPSIWLCGGFGWLAALPRSRFEVRRSRFDVQPPTGTSTGGKPPATRLPRAWLILLGQAEAGGAPGILKVLPRESRNRNQISLNAETQRARRSTARQSRNRMDKDRIMAGQNHVEQRRDLRWQDLTRQGRMILSCHDSVCPPRCGVGCRQIRLVWGTKLMERFGNSALRFFVFPARHSRCDGGSLPCRAVLSRRSLTKT